MRSASRANLGRLAETLSIKATIRAKRVSGPTSVTLT